MRHLAPPTDENADPYNAGDVYDMCVSMVRKLTLKGQLLAIRYEVETESADYEAKAIAGLLYRKRVHNDVASVSADDLVKVYTQRMVPKNSTGRPVYDRIMSAPPNGRCPFCGIGTVNTLDHYLPKTRFPVFCVTPVNLVPACTWCQTEKKEYYPSTNGEQILHPYFDDVGAEIWLKAEVERSAPAGFRFLASPPVHWSVATKARVSTHLRELNLPLLFASNAGSRLIELRLRLKDLLLKGGETSVRAYLVEELASIEAECLNSWTSAMYRAAIADTWFCQGGFLAK